MMPPDTVSLDFLARQYAQLLEEVRASRAENREVRRTFTLISEHFSRQERRFNELRDDVETMIKIEVGGAIANLETRLGNEFEARIGKLELRLTSVEDRLTTVEDRLTAVEDRLTSLASRLGSIETSLGSVETALGSVETSLGSVQREVGDLTRGQAGLTRGQAQLDGKLDAILAAVGRA